MEVEVNGLNPGELFNSYDQLLERLDNHTKESFVYYWRRDSRTVKGASNKTSREIASRLKYYTIRYACVYGGQKFSSKGEGRRKTQSIRKNCPAFIMLRATKSGQQLEVIFACNKHNHEVSENTSKLLPQNRKLPPLLKAEVIEMLRLNVDRKIIIEYCKLKENKHLTRKDLFNLSAGNQEIKLNNDDLLLSKEIFKKVYEFIELNRPKSNKISRKKENDKITEKSQNKFESISLQNGDVNLDVKKIPVVLEIASQNYNYICDQSNNKDDCCLLNNNSVENDNFNLEEELFQKENDYNAFKEIQQVKENRNDLFISDEKITDLNNYLIETLDNPEEFFITETSCYENEKIAEKSESNINSILQSEKIKIKQQQRNQNRTNKSKLLNCKFCGTKKNKLIKFKMELELMRKAKRKLLEETTKLKLKKKKLLFELNKIKN